MESQDELLAQLIQAFKAHATALQAGSTETEVERLTDAVASLLGPYAEDYLGLHVQSATDSDEDEDEDDLNDEDETEFDVPVGATRVSVLARWDFVVNDLTSLQRLVQSQHREDCPDPRLEKSPEYWVMQLFEAACWDAEQYEDHGLEAAGAGSRVEKIERTLFEMDDAERDACPF